MTYEEIIDALVECRESISARRFKSGEAWLTTAHNAKFNPLIQELPPGQRTLLAELLQSEREAGIHDTLVALSELMNLRDLRFSVNGKELPHEPYGTELYFDWVARSAGESWPEKAS